MGNVKLFRSCFGLRMMRDAIEFKSAIDKCPAIHNKDSSRVGFQSATRRTGMKREHGADDPNRGQNHGCPRNCKRFESQISHCSDWGGKACFSYIREPGDLPNADIFAVDRGVSKAAFGSRLLCVLLSHALIDCFTDSLLPIPGSGSDGHGLDEKHQSNAPDLYQLQPN